ncbi:hypothetical protein KY290_007976 [Solanum tuberosum]|uniref:PUB 62/63 C-terminal domain-containing protein n=1 Tax=Solanum tuberosum TaxID=4113 RepID=A0ABQ7W982_SOLTU|nr:hypothetical protein KY290_007976 [Solanum tuberosum]
MLDSVVKGARLSPLATRQGEVRHHRLSPARRCDFKMASYGDIKGIAFTFARPAFLFSSVFASRDPFETFFFVTAAQLSGTVVVTSEQYNHDEEDASTSPLALPRGEAGPCCLLPSNTVLRAVAAAVKHEADQRLFRNAALRKRRKEVGDIRENGELPSENGPHKGVQYPFSVNGKVLIRGNRRTPEKFVGKEAIITSQCLNCWYLLKIMDSGENVLLQYRSLRKFLPTPETEERCQSQTVQNSS